MPNSSPEAALTPPAPKRPRSAQNKIIEAYIHDAKKLLKVATEDPEIRPIARAAFPAEADRISLSLKGGVPEDTGRFITSAESSYAAAGQAPHTAKLTKRGYPAASLTALLENLDDLTSTSGDQDTARGALRGKPGLLAKLEL